ncbi:hypothetical protein BD310DRAFT_568750 [Dichomitus squalens]|uniref:Uncharacterized protein n=1 Tax=Dichomitus squalens TaxID=114155 RepID=A0A4Q9PRT8_9APHY|nr:hypothetical protein BD310DRAFT_568750 [Dichomitus squalens]
MRSPYLLTRPVPQRIQGMGDALRSGIAMRVNIDELIGYTDSDKYWTNSRPQGRTRLCFCRLLTCRGRARRTGESVPRSIWAFVSLFVIWEILWRFACRARGFAPSFDKRREVEREKLLLPACVRIARNRYQLLISTPADAERSILSHHSGEIMHILTTY